MQPTLLQERPRPEPPPPAIVARVQPYLDELYGGMHHIPRDGNGHPWLMVDDFGEKHLATHVTVPLVHKSVASHDGDFGIRAFVLAFKYRLRVEVEYLDEAEEGEAEMDGGGGRYYRGLVLRIWDRSTPDRHGWRHPGLDDLIGMVEKMRGEGEVA